MTIVSTVSISGNVYDVYGTTAELVSYMAGRLATGSFDNASNTDRIKAHVEATRWMDRELWQSVPTDVVTPQPLEHPRVGLTDCNGTPVDDNTLAPGICEGTFELVLTLLNNNTAAAKSGSGSNVKAVGAGPAKVAFFQPGRDAAGNKGTLFPTETQKQVRCYLAGARGLGVIATGTDGESKFTECDRNGLSEGFK